MQKPPEMHWETPKCMGSVPTKRSGHSFSVMGSFAYLFGGCDQRRPPGPNNELYKLDMSQPNEFFWTKVGDGSTGKAPAARWGHTANVYTPEVNNPDRKQIILFGGFRTSSVRYQDVWVLEGDRWEQPAQGITNPENEEGRVEFKKKWQGCPHPRGAHSATIMGSNLMVFGGYGGPGYSRRDFNDLHILDLTSWQWSKIETTGEIPEPRSGHQMVAVRNKLYVCGGWNSMNQFNDLRILDTETWCWSVSSGGGAEWGVQRWNHTAISVRAVPHWKIFVFGGNSGNLNEDAPPQGTYISDLCCLETEHHTWSRPTETGEVAPPRSDSQMVYHEETGNLVLFGGWANRWYGDCRICNVSEVVGPPYSINTISPATGPITGKTKVFISGMGFNSVEGSVSIRFACMKGFLEVAGEVVSDSEVTFLTPDYKKYGAVVSEVRVKIGDKNLTNQVVHFSYFSVMDANTSLAFGPGIIDGCAAKNPALFVIQAKDSAGNNRVCGMDQFKISVINKTEEAEIEKARKKKRKPGTEEEKEGSAEVASEIVDHEDGTYTVSYVPETAGEYQVSVEFLGTFDGVAGPIRGSPFTLQVAEEGEKSTNILEGPLMMGRLKEDTKSLKDYSNTTLKGLKRAIPEDDRSALIKQKEHLNSVEVRKDELHLMIDSNKAALLYLKRKGNNVDRMIDALDNSASLLKDVEKQAPNTSNAIIPLTQKWEARTETEVLEYQKALAGRQEEFRKNKFWDYDTGPEEARKMLDAAEKRLTDEQKQLDHCAHLTRIFEYPELIEESASMKAQMDKEVVEMRKMWDVSDNLQCFVREAYEILWAEINPENLEDETKQHVKAVKALSRDVRWCDAFKQTDKFCKDFLNTIPLLQLLGSKAMRPRHWVMLQKATGKDFTPPYEDPDMLVGGILALNLHEFTNDVEEICDQAAKEEKMENTLAQLEERWEGIEWLMDPYKDTDVPLLKMQEEDFESLEADQLAVQGMMASRYLKQFEKEVTLWQKELATTNDVFLILQEIQRTWSYLEPLFIHSDEVKRELPEDAVRFAGIDVDVKAMLKQAWETKNIKAACNADGLVKQLESIQELLDICKKSLADFLDGRRRQFPRYYFTSEADLLDILSNGSNPEKILVHVPKVYLCTKTLVLSAEKTATNRPITNKFIAGVGVEEVAFEPPVPLEGKVEIYMQTVLDAMKQTLFANLKRSLMRYTQMSRPEWIMHKDSKSGKPSDPAQIILLTLAVFYVKECEDALNAVENGNKKALEKYNEQQIDQLSDLIRLTQSDLNKGERTRVMVCITMDTHGRDIVQRMIREGVSTINSFQWQSQLKHKYRVAPPHASFKNRDPSLRGEGGERAEIAILNACLPYDYEYLGNGPRLVITPLTDRIYVTATQALNLKMGCAPAGPAGTGKTETTKDLANALAKCCYVFNCSPEMDYKGLGNIFKGLASSGSWGCFDEFNRLIPEVLSVCSVQFKAVCDGVKAELARIVVEGDEISLDPTCGAYITMNPGYLGRSELPEGLKALFRPMTVMVPDLVLICENMLMSEGFVGAKVLASKFYGLYSLLRELLSKQMHYDWGLRAVKSVLVVAGGFKRAEPDLPEGDLLMRALRDFNIPKIVREDEVVFFGLLGDLFPGINPPRKVDPELEDLVHKACIEIGNHPDEVFKLKVVQLEELAAIRHCVFVMGPPAAGKSQCWRTLIAARNLRDPDSKTIFTDINPKSVKTEELYGYISMATREWKDGLLSKIMRDLGQIPNEKPKWILLDGDLDANWIESMNSVMDDNRMLTLASNERIPLKPYMRMIFEIRDLRFATPATVSRAGILYISADDGTQWRSLIASWVSNRPEAQEVKDMMTEYFERYVADALLWMKINVQRVLPMEEMNLVQSLLFMLDGLLTPKNTEDPEQLDIVFVFCLIWALGSSLTMSDDGTDYRKVFSEYWKGEFKSVKFPSRDTVFDYWLDPETGTFDKWDKSPYFYTIEYDSTTPMATVTVPTPETGSVTFWMQLLVGMGKAIMLAGPAGTGKTQMINGLLQKQDPEEIMSTTINFNFYTTSAVLQNTMFIPLEKKTGTNYGPPGNMKLIYFVDDLNLPEVDVYDTQSAIALLRQKMEYCHVYDLIKMNVRNIAKTQVVASMNPTAGSFQINPRLQRNFTTFAIGMPGQTSLLTIYQTFLDGHLKNFEDEVASLSSALIKAALTLHQLVVQNFRKTAREFHYEFNIRHLSNVFQGLLVAQPEQFKVAEKFVQLWLHESERVYGDRLVSLEDLLKYKGLAQNQAKKTFPSYNVTKFFANEKAEPLVFCHFAENIQDRVYDQVTSLESMNKILDEALREYNETNATMDLVLFEDAMKHVARIVRIVLNQGGHALLVGVGGSGKQSLSRLAAFICSYTVKQIVISSTYGINDLRDDLKAMYMKAGMKDEGVMFLLTDSQITNERFLIFINDLLASGNIPDLFATDEVDGIVNGLTSRVKAAGIVPDRKNCWDFFINETRRNLHTVLAFSPVGDDMRNRAKKFPALVNCTVIDWFQPWPKDALFSVGKKFLADVDIEDDRIRKVIEGYLPFSFEKVNDAAKIFLANERRHVYTTPKSYLELLKLYNVLLKNKREDEEAAIKRLSDGLLKLKETKEAVTKIEEDLKVSLEEADQKKTVAEGIAEDVAREKAVVEVETAKAQVEAEQVAKIQAEVSVKQKDTEEDLAKAEPAVEAAMAALDTLDKKDLGMCKTMGTPPHGVDDVFAATMVMLAGIWPNVVCSKAGKVKDRSWGAAKKQLLGNIGEYMEALKSIKKFVDDGSMPAINLKEVRPYLEMEHFDPETIKTKNSAAAGLCNFVQNIVEYRDIVVTVEPKRQALAEANAQLDAANTRLKQVNELVADLEAKLAILTSQLADANKEKQDAMDTVARGQQKLDLAQRLTTALASENERWAINVEALEANKALLTGDVLLATSFISYVGPFTKKYRDELMQKSFGPYLQTEFRKALGEEGQIPMSEEIEPMKMITKGAEIANWQQNGLPSDQVSTENAAIVSVSTRWPLMIDPQLQGINWIRRMEETPERNLQIVRLGQNDILRKLQAALENGWSILIENLGESIDAVLNPVIQRATIRRGKKQYLKLGDTEVEFHKSFRLFLHTKLSNPHYPPEIQAEAALVNFTVTITGLEDQLLSLVVRKERLDLATLSEFLIEQQNSFKIKILELEDNILFRLANAEGDITEDVELIEGLEETKRISTDINEKAAKAVETQTQIKITSEKYRPVANRSALLFFMMNDLFKIHSYYIYSLAAFTTVFYRGIDLVTTKSKQELEKEAELTPVQQGDDPGTSRKSREASDMTGAVDEDERRESTFSEAGENADAGEDEDEDQEEKKEEKKELTDEELVERNKVLIDSITLTVFSYVRRGLFERDKLTVATLMTLTILSNDGLLDQDDVDFLVASKISMDPGNMGPLHEWLPEVIWPKIKALEGMKRMQNLGDQMQSDSDDWQSWFDQPAPENSKLPGDYQKTLNEFDRIVLLRALRPDRTSTALQAYIGRMMGNEYVFQPPFDMTAAYEETSNETPVFFVLFPGVDPTPWVESLGKKLNITIDNGKFINISMGQGQEAPAESVVERFAKEGGWVMLQNCHLMQSWVPKLERMLEIVQENAHKDFRCFISAEPPPMASMKNMPESLLQSCIKVANEAPADIKSNLTRAWHNFDQEMIDTCNKPTEFKGCLFTLCWFHSIVLGRRRFGQQGWSRAYSFNTGDLTICADVLHSYLNSNPDVPWDDLRYIFGEIMYGGHITDAWDRTTNNTYLKVLLQERIFEGFELAPNFKCPKFGEMQYDDFFEFINTALPPENPPQFGLHTNAEIGYLTNSTNSLFTTILQIKGGSGGGGGGGGSSGDAVKTTMLDLLERLPENFEMVTLGLKAKPLLEGESGPFVVVAMQECNRMNALTSEIRRSLTELDKGLKGQLNMSQSMEDLVTALTINEWPGRNPFALCKWEKLAWPSKKGLISEFNDMLLRIEELQKWVATFDTPYCMWLPGLFNPTAYLTAVMQVTARASGSPLDKMTTETHITTYYDQTAIDFHPDDGIFIHGIYIEGARWPALDELENTEHIGNVNTGGFLCDSRLKELLPLLPVIYVKAVPVQPNWEPSAVGYLRHTADVYECPVYITSFRGPTYVFLATMKTEAPVSKWVLTGTAMVMQTDD